MSLQDPDAVFAALVAAHEGLEEAVSRRVDAALVLLLADRVGNDAAVLACIRDALASAGVSVSPDPAAARGPP